MNQLGSAAALVALLASGCGVAGENGVASVSSTARQVTIYYYEAAGRHPELYVRPFYLHPATVVVEDTGDSARDAVTGLLENESERERLHTTWHGDNCAPASEVRAVRQTPDLITVNLVEMDADDTGLAVCDMSQEGASIQIQQMVWTIRRATRSNAPVQIMLGKERFGSATKADPKVAPLPVVEPADRSVTKPAGAEDGGNY